MRAPRYTEAMTDRPETDERGARIQAMLDAADRGEGFEVGPDFEDFRARSLERLALRRARRASRTDATD